MAILNAMFAYGRRHAAPVALLAAGALAAVGVVVGQVTPPSIPTVNLSPEPLYARGFRAKPTLTLALSVEFPTVGAAFVNGADRDDDPNYSPTNEYVGYFDPAACYTYDDTGKFFTRSGNATNRTCGGTAFSGNFMNWAQTSAIDVLRYGLTGGDRVVDTSTDTVLQRAVIPKGFYNSNNFPSKQLQVEHVAGAVPAALLRRPDGSNWGGIVYVANCLNRMFFGTERVGNCDAPGNNGNLGTPASVVAPTPTTWNAPLPAEYGTTACAPENGTCTFTGTRLVAYGASNRFFIRAFTGTAPCNNATFGDPINGTFKYCYVSNDTISTGTPLTADAYFTTRVKVCTAAEASLRGGYCTRYPSGNYKPTGRLQQYSDRLRVSVFGYLRDDTLKRYGGVLRAPMKYVGPKHFDGDFKLQSDTNPASEWSANTGVFVGNPLGAGEGISGAINYLNQFGRTGAVGVYKTYDPVTELYYEALRYIQGLDPTPEAVSGLTTDMKDGFPVYTSWTDPHPAITGLSTTGDNTYACVKNNILTIGDVNTHADKSLPGNSLTTNEDFSRSARPDYNEPDFVQWTRVVGAFDSNGAQSYVDGKGASRVTSNPSTVNASSANLDTKVPGCCNGNRFYMAGAAYWANTHDIRAKGLSGYSSNKARPGMRARTFMIDVNEYGQETAEAKYKNNQFYLTAKYGGFQSEKNKLDNGNPFVGEDGVTRDNTVWSRTVPTSVASDGMVARTYFQGNNAKELLAALEEIFASVVREAGSIAGAAVSTSRLTTTAGVFQGSFDPSDWSGDLARYQLSINNSTGAVEVGDADSPTTVSAAQKLDARTTARNIFIGRTTPTLAGAATTFAWDDLDTDHKNYLRTPAGGNGSVLDSEDMGRDRLAYLSGDRSKEGSPFRVRGSRLGDIVNSGAVFVGPPPAGGGDDAYNSFAAAASGRPSTVFVGANDGMLHAFDAGTLEERFAYIPSFVAPKLSELTSPTYVHRSFVDGTPTVAEAKVGSSWKTVLVSGVGGGGQGVFALDVSNASTFGASNVMWEFSDRDDPSMGNVVGRPRVVKMRTSAAGATPTYKWYAIVPAGVNNYAGDGRFSTTGKAAIFILDLAKAPTQAWALNTNYFKLEFPSADATKANAVINLSVTGGQADEVAYLYAGDLQGNLWKLDFTTKASSDWTAEKLTSFKDGSGAPLPLFVARESTSPTARRQPITIEPAVAFGPGRSHIVAFGTGKFLETSDLDSPFLTQSFYAVYDSLANQIPGRDYLQTVTAASGELSTSNFAWGVPTSATDTTARAGWVFDFPSSSVGERQVSGVTVIGGKLFFGTVEPATNGCADGSGRIYIANLATGGGSFTASTVGIQGEPLIFKLGGDVITPSDPTGGARRTTRWQILQQGSTGVKPLGVESVSSTVERTAWRQIFNFQELKNKP